MKNILKECFFKVRLLIYLILGNIDNVFGRKCRVFTLCYHSISSDNWRYSVSPESFKKQISYLRKNFESISGGKLYDYLKGNLKMDSPSFVLTFDDGYEDLLGIRTFIKKSKIKPILFLASDVNKINRKSLDTSRRLLSTRQIKSFIKEGWNIGCHTSTHPEDLRKLSFIDLINEIGKAKKSLEERLNTEIEYLSYPKGKYNKKVMEIVKNSGFKAAFSMDSGIVWKKSNIFALPREGVDRTHTFAEFKSLFLPSVITFKKLVKIIVEK